MFLFCLVFAMSLCTSVYMCFVVTCWERADLLALVLWCLIVNLSLSHWYPGSGLVLDCIDSWSLHPYLLSYHIFILNNRKTAYKWLLNNPYSKRKQGCPVWSYILSIYLLLLRLSYMIIILYLVSSAVTGSTVLTGNIVSM